MGWADWMVINQSLEEELEVERSVEKVYNCDDEEALKQLCTLALFGKAGIRASCLAKP